MVIDLMVRWFLLWFMVLAAPAAMAGQAAIATAHPLATKAGEEILLAGGNAFDAAVAVSAALAVVEPYGSGLGGGGFWLLQRSADGFETMVDGREKAPMAATPALFFDEQGQVIREASLDGPRAAGIPGTPAALVHISQVYGRLPLEKVLAPAIRYARQGFVVTPRYQEAVERGLKRILLSQEASRIFLKQNRIPKIGTVIRQPQLASTFELLAAKGHFGFYGGHVAKRLVAAVRRGGGVWTEKDLAAYGVQERAPIVFTYRGARIVSASPPSSGGVALAETLNILSYFGLERMDDGPRVHLVAEALRRAFEDRTRYLGDPDFVEVPVERLTSSKYAARRQAEISIQRASGAPLANENGGGQNTTHFSIADHEGNRVAATLSINTWFGSGFVAGDTGVLLNNEMDDFVIAPGVRNTYGLTGNKANLVEPQKRPLSSMSPTIMEEKDGGVLVLGTPGGSRIISMVALALVQRALDPEQGLAELLAEPRFHHQGQPEVLLVEPGFDAGKIAELEAMGHKVQVHTRKWGNMQIVAQEGETGRSFAASDPRGEGVALVIAMPPKPEGKKH